MGRTTNIKPSDHRYLQVEVISTGSLSLDHALGVGGLPKGRVVEVKACPSAMKPRVGIFLGLQCPKHPYPIVDEPLTISPCFRALQTCFAAVELISRCRANLAGN